MRAMGVVGLLIAVAGVGSVAGQQTVEVRSGDAVVRGRLYRAEGEGVHPTVLLLHGYPGNQQNEDIAEAVQSAGWNVLLMHYRGSWNSTGWFSFANALDDVRNVLAALRAPEAARVWGVDGKRIALVGHSMGGALALGIAARDPGVCCVAALAPGNAAVSARLARADSTYRKAWIAGIEAPTRQPSPPIRFAPGQGGAQLAEYAIAHIDSLDFATAAALLAGRRLLLVGASDDRLAPPAQHLQPLLDALKAAGAQRVTSVFLADDHNFSAGRARVAALVAGWL